MENLRNIYDLNTKYILGAKDNYFQNTRDNLIKNFFIDNKLIKNNESIKHIDPKVYRNINFRINDEKLSYQTLKDNNLDPSIVVNDGLKYDLINLDSLLTIDTFPLIINSPELNNLSTPG